MLAILAVRNCLCSLFSIFSETLSEIWTEILFKGPLNSNHEPSNKGSRFDADLKYRLCGRKTSIRFASKKDIFLQNYFTFLLLFLCTCTRTHFCCEALRSVMVQTGKQKLALSTKQWTIPFFCESRKTKTTKIEDGFRL